MRTLIIGAGETGQALFEILSRSYETLRIDPKFGFSAKIDSCDIMNVCIGYSSDFVDIVCEYQKKYHPYLTVIHSTVPVGTTSKIKDAVHSPILGDHTNMKNSIMKFTKWIGGMRADEIYRMFLMAGIVCKTVPTSEETELLKLMCLAKYGMSIAFAQYQKNCFDKSGFDYSHVLEWDINYNMNAKPYQQRPLIRPPENKIGGHCVIPGTKMLNEMFPNPILEEVLKYA